MSIESLMDLHKLNIGFIKTLRKENVAVNERIGKLMDAFQDKLLLSWSRDEVVMIMHEADNGEFKLLIEKGIHREAVEALKQYYSLVDRNDQSIRKLIKKNKKIEKVIMDFSEKHIRID